MQHTWGSAQHAWELCTAHLGALCSTPGALHSTFHALGPAGLWHNADSGLWSALRERPGHKSVQRPGKAEASALSWRSAHFLAAHTFLKVGMWHSLPRGLGVTSSVNIHHGWPRVLACLQSVMWASQNCSAGARGRGGPVHLCPDGASWEENSSSSRGQSPWACRLEAQAEASEDPLVFSLFPCLYLLLSQEKNPLGPLWPLEFIL